MSGLKWDAVPAVVDGEHALVILPVTPDDGPPELREGIARRRIIATTGHCPCGAQLTYPNRAERRLAKKRRQEIRTWVEHRDGCPAVDSTLIPLIREMSR